MQEATVVLKINASDNNSTVVNLIVLMIEIF